MDELFKYKKCRYSDNLDIYEYFCIQIDYNVKIVCCSNQEKQKIINFIND